MTRIALLSDIHGNLPALKAVLSDLEPRHADCVFCLGDHVSGPMWPKETIDLLRQQNWTFIRGNHDRCLSMDDPVSLGLSDGFAHKHLAPGDLEWLASMPSRVVTEDGMLLCHGAPDKDTTYLLETIEQGRTRLSSPDEVRGRLGAHSPALILCGHTHVPRVVRLQEGILFVNPGSVGMQAFDDDSPIGGHVVENGSPHARYALMEETASGWRIELIVVEYDHSKAADQARQNGRPDFEIALRTGYARR
jgi:predicted phosphodiesterase